jgi:hypothetical protein
MRAFPQKLYDVSVCIVRLLEVFELAQALAAATSSLEDAAKSNIYRRKKSVLFQLRITIALCFVPRSTWRALQQELRDKLAVLARPTPDQAPVASSALLCDQSGSQGRLWDFALLALPVCFWHL